MANHTVEPSTPGFSVGEFADIVEHLAVFGLIILVGYAVGRAGRFLYAKGLRKTPTSGQVLFGKLLLLIAMSVALLLALRLVYDVEPLSLLATFGVVSLALGFGLQNTVANLAAGFGLTMDKPFEVGDRIRIGETWGDVVTIGLRSTRIVTVNGDLVVVPNSILDTRELWNYTFQDHTKFRLDLPVQITYDSSIRLAEQMMLEAARTDDQVLAYPEPQVRVMGFAADGVNMELRIWINRAQQRPAVRDRILRRIKDRFDSQGVHFPFPQRTISYAKDLKDPAPTPEFLAGEAGDKPVVLVVTKNRAAASAMADGVVKFVERLESRMVVLHVRRPAEAMSPYEGQAALNIYLDRAQHAGIAARAVSEVGELPKVLRRVVRETGAKLVIFGRPQTRWLGVGWVRSEVGGAQAASPVPVVLVDTHGEAPDEVVEKWRRHLHPPDDAETVHDGETPVEHNEHD